MDNRKNLYNLAYMFQIISIVINIRTIAIISFMVWSYLTLWYYDDDHNIVFNFIWFILTIIIAILVYLTSFAWMIPMTLMTKKAANEVEPKNHLALGLFTLFF
ncbi:hypothetical protein [Spiroplasma endosymbiont of Labia minor]|uniref:hypothetical protein n=1 Tax=Spiroplasma endosymbiont of Labia minor TaxID=3066305 RepID=UPI0030CAC051